MATDSGGTAPASSGGRTYGRAWLASRLQTLRDQLSLSEPEGNVVDEIAMPMLITLASARNALMLYMGPDEQPTTFAGLVAAVARIGFGMTMSAVSVDATTTAQDFVDRLFAPPTNGGKSSPTREYATDPFFPASSLPSGAAMGADGRATPSVAAQRIFEKPPLSPGRNPSVSGGSRPSLVPGMNRKYSGIAAAPRKLPGVVLVWNIQFASKELQAFLFDALESKQLPDRSQVHALPQPFLLVAVLPASLAEKRIGLSLELTDMIFLSNTLESVAPQVALPPDVLASPTFTTEDIDSMKARAGRVFFHTDLERYAWDLTVAVRQHRLVYTPPTPQGREDFFLVIRTAAALFGYNFVTATHVRLAYDKAVAHRIVLKENHGDVTPMEVVSDCLDSVPTPL
ncbi:hypothetical protein DFJ74DRAFT_673260 [Hyaloraphidium curvatum]|nr:hypothetical protein DFJ74DRAFT_673260 [Hyaloraphidium curvatum]